MWSTSQRRAARPHPGNTHNCCRTRTRCCTRSGGRYPADWRRCAHCPASSHATGTPVTHPAIPPGVAGGPVLLVLLVLSGGGVGLLVVGGGPVSVGGGPRRRGAHPWATGRPPSSVRVKHHRLRGSLAIASPRERLSSAVSGPNPGTSPGDSMSPSHVPSGIVRLTIPATAIPLPGPAPPSAVPGPPGAGGNTEALREPVRGGNPEAPGGPVRPGEPAAPGAPGRGADGASPGGSRLVIGWPVSSARNTWARN